MYIKRIGTIPKYFGGFIVLAMLPQILGFNGSAIDTVYKLLLVGLLFFKTTNLRNAEKISVFSCVFLFIGFVNTSGAIVVNNISIFRELYTYIVGVLLAIIFVDSVLNEKTLKFSDTLPFYKIIVYFMLIAAIYNLIINFNSLLHITSISIYGAEGNCSFFDNKNTFGVFLIFAVLASTILRILTKEKKWIFFNAVFLINEMMALCRTAIVLSLVMLVISFFADNKNKFKNILTLFVIVIAIIVFVNMNESISNYILNIFGNTNSMDARDEYIGALLPFAKGIHLWFGYGNEGASEMALAYTGNAYYHNAYLKALMMGGILKLGLQIYAIFFSVKYGLKCRKLQKTIGNLCLLSTIVYIIYVCVESVILFDTPVVAIMAVIFIISMPILFYNSLINERTTR